MQDECESEQCYALDACKYSYAGFVEYYGLAATYRFWPMAQAVTDSVICIVKTLGRAGHDLRTHSAMERDSLRDALDVLLAWCDGKVPRQSPASECTTANPFERLATSFALPLYFRMFALAESGRDLGDREPLPKPVRDAAWKHWREAFKQYELKPWQRFCLFYMVGLASTHTA